MRFLFGKRRGLTLVELLVVIMTIGILGTLALAKYADVKEEAYVSAMKNDLRHLAFSQAVHHDDTGSYADDLDILEGYGLSPDVFPIEMIRSPDGWLAIYGHNLTTTTCMVSSLMLDEAIKILCPGDEGIQMAHSPDDPAPFQPVQFSAELYPTTLWSPGPTSLTWWLGDGTAIQGTSNTHAIITHAYEEAGIYKVVLRAIRPDGEPRYSTRTVTVSGSPAGTPYATILQPSDGSSFPWGSDITFSGTGTSPIAGTLSGSSLIWRSDLDGDFGTGQSFQSTVLSVGTHIVSLEVTDPDSGIQAYADVVVDVEPTPPTASILAPGDGDFFNLSDPISFSGEAVTMFGAPLEGGSLQWTSSLDGAIGSGTAFSRSDLSPGAHEIILMATDDTYGVSAADQVSIEVLEGSEPVPIGEPSATILSPSGGETFSVAQGVTFTGTGTDGDGANLPDENLSWTSSLDGALGTGASLPTAAGALSPGIHTVTFSATDPDTWITATDEVVFTVRSLELALEISGSGSVQVTYPGFNQTLSTSATLQGIPLGTSVTLEPSAASGSAFSVWTGDGSGSPSRTVSMTGDAAATATFASASYDLSLGIAGTGSGNVNVQYSGFNQTFSSGATVSAIPHGTEVTLTPSASVGSSVSGWSGSGTGSPTRTVTMTGNTSSTASFSLQNRTLTLTIDGTGNGSVRVQYSGYDTWHSSSVSLSIPYGTAVTLTRSPSTGSSFAGWSGSCTGTNSTCSVTMTSNRSVTATFNLQNRTLSLTIDGAGSGSVRVQYSGYDTWHSSSVNLSIPYGTGVTLTRSTGSGSTWAGWGGSCSGTGSSCSLSMTANRSVTATFDQSIVYRSLSLSILGTGSGTVTVSYPGHNQTHSSGATISGIPDGTTVSLSRNVGSGSTFGGWGGYCSGTGTSCSVPMTTNRSVSATFDQMIVYRTLTLNIAGTGSGTVRVQYSGFDQTYGSSTSLSIPDGTSVTLTRNVGSGSTFGGWSGACSGTGSTCSVSMTANRSVTATFNLLTYNLSLSIEGTGSGSVTVSYTGYNQTHSSSTTISGIPNGTTVTLTRNVGPNSEFGSWGGACSGTSSTCTVSMTTNRSVTATFDEFEGFVPVPNFSRTGCYPASGGMIVSDHQFTSTSSHTNPSWDINNLTHSWTASGASWPSSGSGQTFFISVDSSITTTVVITLRVTDPNGVQSELIRSFSTTSC